MIRTLYGNDTPLVLPLRANTLYPRVETPSPRVHIPLTSTVDPCIPNLIVSNDNDHVHHHPAVIKTSVPPRSRDEHHPRYKTRNLNFEIQRLSLNNSDVSAHFATTHGQYITANSCITNAKNFTNAVINKETGIALEYRVLSTGTDKATYICSLANGIVRIIQGVGNRIYGNNTVFFINPSQFPKGKNSPTVT